MKSYGLDMYGDFKTNNIKAQDGTSAIDIDDSTGKVTVSTLKFDGGTPASGKTLESDASGNCSWGYSAVPSGEIILFEKNTAVTGYSLLTTVDDEVIYITKGSAAGGETGATSKLGSTWTQPNHTLTIDEIPSHSHTRSFFWASTSFVPGISSGVLYASSNTLVASTGNTGGGGAHNHGSTWRPKGRNFTRQQRS